MNTVEGIQMDAFLHLLYVRGWVLSSLTNCGSIRVGKCHRHAAGVDAAYQEGQMTIAEFYASNEWKLCRNAYRRKVGGLCERCAQNGRIVPGDEVHHKQRLTPRNVNNPAVTLSFENLELLCEDCHHAEHFHGKRRWRFDRQGRLTIPPSAE